MTAQTAHAQSECALRAVPEGPPRRPRMRMYLHARSACVVRTPHEHTDQHAMTNTPEAPCHDSHLRPRELGERGLVRLGPHERGDLKGAVG